MLDSDINFVNAVQFVIPDHSTAFKKLNIYILKEKKMPAESNEVAKEATPEVKPEVVAARPLVFLDIEVIISYIFTRKAGYFSHKNA